MPTVECARVEGLWRWGSWEAQCVLPANDSLCPTYILEQYMSTYVSGIHACRLWLLSRHLLPLSRRVPCFFCRLCRQRGGTVVRAVALDTISTLYIPQFDPAELHTKLRFTSSRAPFFSGSLPTTARNSLTRWEHTGVAWAWHSTAFVAAFHSICCRGVGFRALVII